MSIGCWPRGEEVEGDEEEDEEEGEEVDGLVRALWLLSRSISELPCSAQTYKEKKWRKFQATRKQIKTKKRIQH